MGYSRKQHIDWHVPEQEVPEAWRLTPAELEMLDLEDDLMDDTIASLRMLPLDAPFEDLLSIPLMLCIVLKARGHDVSDDLVRRLSKRMGLIFMLVHGIHKGKALRISYGTDAENPGSGKA